MNGIEDFGFTRSIKAAYVFDFLQRILWDIFSFLCRCYISQSRLKVKCRIMIFCAWVCCKTREISKNLVPQHISLRSNAKFAARLFVMFWLQPLWSLQAGHLLKNKFYVNYQFSLFLHHRRCREKFKESKISYSEDSRFCIQFYSFNVIVSSTDGFTALQTSTHTLFNLPIYGNSGSGLFKPRDRFWFYKWHTTGLRSHVHILLGSTKWLWLSVLALISTS